MKTKKMIAAPLHVTCSVLNYSKGQNVQEVKNCVRLSYTNGKSLCCVVKVAGEWNRCLVRHMFAFFTLMHLSVLSRRGGRTGIDCGFEPN